MDGIEAAQNAHRQNDAWIFAALEEVSKDVVGDPPEEGNDPAVCSLVHIFFRGVLKRILGPAFSAASSPGDLSERVETSPASLLPALVHPVARARTIRRAAGPLNHQSE